MTQKPAPEPAAGPRVGLSPHVPRRHDPTARRLRRLHLLREAGCRVEVPRSQTCCGQPAFNSGDTGHTRGIAKQVTAFEQRLCRGAVRLLCWQIRTHYPELFAFDAHWAARSEALAEQTHELLASSSIYGVMRRRTWHFAGSATYHDTCSGLREMGVKAQPRRLLASVKGLSMRLAG